MLPTLGLFKSILCPSYFQNSDKNSCLRPYCHFKHPKFDESQKIPDVPKYTLKSKVVPQLLTLTDGAPYDKNRRKLEYTPVQPAFDAFANDLSEIQSSNNVPVYIPSNAARTSIDLSDCFEELDELANIVNDQLIDESVEPSYQNDLHLETEIKNSKKDKKEKEEPATKPSKTISDQVKINKKTDLKTDLKQKSNHNLSHSTSSHSRRTHESKLKEIPSKHSKDKKDESNSSKKHVKPQNDHGKSEHTSTSNRNSHSSTKHKSKNLLSNKECEYKNKKHQYHEKKLSEFSDCSFTKEHRKKANVSESKEQEEPFASTQEDIMKECEMIYDQLENEYSTLESFHNSNKDVKIVQDPKAMQMPTENNGIIGTSKKNRTAYENERASKDMALPITKYKPNYMQVALKSVFQRREIIKKEEETLSTILAAKIAERKMHEANEELCKSKKTLTPLIPSSYLTPTTKSAIKSIAPVTNTLALANAKKRIEELQANKLRSLTASQSVSKLSGRTAHKPSAAIKQENSKPAPPILEPTSTKISYNIRMQFYELMVKQCISIYFNLPDAWERAQSEELGVLKKCNTPIIYKRSALLTINKLRKEAVEAGNTVSCKDKTVSHDVVLAGKHGHNISWSVKKNENRFCDRRAV